MWQSVGSTESEPPQPTSSPGSTWELAGNEESTPSKSTFYFNKLSRGSHTHSNLRSNVQKPLGHFRRALSQPGGPRQGPAFLYTHLCHSSECASTYIHTTLAPRPPSPQILFTITLYAGSYTTRQAWATPRQPRTTAGMQKLPDTSTHRHVFHKGPGTHLVLAGHVHLVAEKLCEVHDGHGCWASQEAHPCLLGERDPRAGVHPRHAPPARTPLLGRLSTHLLLVAVPVLQGALLLLPVPAEGERMKQGDPRVGRICQGTRLGGPPRGTGTAGRKDPA